MRYDVITGRQTRVLRGMRSIGRPVTVEEIAAASPKGNRLYRSLIKIDLPSMKRKGAVSSEVGLDGIERWSIVKDVK